MKRVVALFILCFSLQQAQAQFDGNRRVNVYPGLRAGLNLANFTNWQQTDVRPDFYIGGMVSIDLAKFYTLQPEINYTRQGAEYRPGSNINFPGNQNMSRDLEVQYLSFALMNKFYIVDEFHAIIGPSIDFKIGDNLSNEWIGDSISDIDFALQGGLGYTLDFGLTIEARYKMGLIDIFGYQSWLDNNGNNIQNDVILNSVLQLGLCYSF